MPFVQQRRGTKAQLEAANEIPLDGQLIIEEQLDGFQKIKIGDGVTHYNSLEYVTQKLSDLHDVDAFVSPTGPDGQILVRNNGSNFTETYVPYAAIGSTPLGNYPAGSLGEKINTKVDNTDARLTDERVPTDNSVSTAKLADDAVTSAKIAANAVTNSEIAANTILTGNIAAGAINTQSITDDAVTFAKMQDISANSLLGAASSGAVTQIVCRQIGRDILDDSTAADVRTTIGAVQQSDIDTAIANLIDSAPGALDTLNELAAALGDDASFSTTVTNSIATKLPLAGGTVTGDIDMSRSASSATKIDWGNSSGGNFSSTPEDLDYIRLYTSGTTYAGMGITTSNFNIGTKGAINVSFYAAGVLNERKTGTLTRHYVDQFFNAEIYVAQGNTPTAPKISVEGDSDTGIYFPADNKVAVSAGGVQQLIITNQALEVFAGAIYSPLYRVNTDGTKTLTAYGRTGDNDTGIYFPDADEVSVSAGGKDRVTFDEDRTTFHRESGKETIKAGTENAGYMIIDSSGGYLSLNHYSPDHLLLNYTSGGSGNVIINAPSTTVSAANPTNRKLYVHGTIESSAETHAQRYLVNGYGSATDPAFEIAHTVDGTGFYSPSSMVNGGNSAGYGFAISAAHNHVAEFGYKSHIGNGRPTIYGGAAAALLELNGNSRRGSLFGYNIYATSASNANAAIGGEFLCIAQGGTSANSPKGFKAKLQSQSANGSSAVGGHFELSLESVTGSWGNAYGVHCELNIASSCTGSLTGSSAALFVDAVGKTSNATYPSTDGIDNVYAIFQTGNTDNNRFDGTSWFRNNVHIVNNGDLNISSGSGQIILPNGSATDPAICFGASTNTGMYYDSGLALGFAGTTKITIAAQVTTFTNQTRIPDGSAAAPSIAFSSSTNTGISYSSNNLNLVYAGSNKVSIGGGGVTIGNVPTTLNGAVAITQGLPLSEIAQGGATSGQTLQWNGSTWSPTTPSGGSGGASSLNGLNDVVITGTPSDNSLIRYDSGNSVFENYNPDSFTSSSGSSVAINLADGNKMHEWTCASSGVQTVVLLNIPSTSGISCSFTLVIKYPGSGTTTAIVQWPSSFKWPGGVAPTLTNTGGKQDTFTFLSLDNGGSWLGHVGGQNF